jgi:hypothetical protein
MARKPISDPRHEAMETPEEERYEHETGKEVQDRHGRRRKRGSRRGKRRGRRR